MKDFGDGPWAIKRTWQLLGNVGNRLKNKHFCDPAMLQDAWAKQNNPLWASRNTFKTLQVR